MLREHEVAGSSPVIPTDRKAADILDAELMLLIGQPRMM